MRRKAWLQWPIVLLCMGFVITCRPFRSPWVLQPQPFPTTGTWYRGNLHTHTDRSDGALAPDVVVQRYEAAGYDFLFLTDHNQVVEGPQGQHMLVLPGEEVTPRRGPHIHGLGIRHRIRPKTVGTLVEAVRRVRLQDGIPVANHPACPTPLSAAYVRALKVRHLEVINGIAGTRGFETELQLWDELLSSGYFCFAVGGDDAHLPEHIGQAWVMVRAPRLSESAIHEALRRGDFYVSTGATIRDLRCDGQVIAIEAPGATQIRFIGREGRVLAEVFSESARYVLQGTEGYVRVEVADADGRRAWTQPLYYAL